ncbi:MAG: TonB-dependent receptor [Rhodospirillaceae bacterium]|nr:TonB-dependent receptor [Rhodospirillaceae bacterium]
MSKSIKSVMLASAAAVVIANSPVVTMPVLAQQVALEEIVVTARRRNESLLDVPLTVTALTSADIEIKAIDELSDIVDYAPGFFYGGATVGRNDRSNRRLIMRGMQVSTDVQTRQGTTMFIDGAPVLGAEIGSTESAERIEIVKGPQSAYFGRSTFAGAINVITKNPGQEWKGKITAEAGRFATSDFGAEIEGPIVADKLAIRLSGSQYQTGGNYRNGTNTSEKLGRRETIDFAGTLYATPNDQFTAKLRVHYWEDDDGPSASIGYGVNNGEDLFNCNLGGTAGIINPALSNNNWICGTPPQPRPDQIQADNVVTPLIAQILLGNDTVAAPSLGFIFDPQFIKGFGFKRRAFEASLGLDYELSNGITISSITAAHSNEWAALDDLDRRNTADIGVVQDVILLNNRDDEDFSQEIRIASPDDQRLTWMIGGSYYDGQSIATAGFNLFGAFRSFNFGGGNDVQTTGIFGSGAYDISDQLNLSVEARYQWDEVTDGAVGGQQLSGTFNSFSPRVILDYKPNEDMTIYASFARGYRPGEFNASLVGLPQSVLDQVAAAIGADISVDEEKLDNYEIGFKGSLFDGQAQFTAAFYYAEWRGQHTRGLAPVTFPDGSEQIIATTGTGGSTDLKGIELELDAALTENFTIDGSFAWNESKIKSRDCADCLIILGFREIAGLNNSFSRTPTYSGTAAATYRDSLTEDYDWFGRVDFIYTGNRWATDANVTGTGSASRVNVRVGVEDDALRVELYGTNIFDDRTFTGFQRLTEFAFGGGRSFLSAALPDKPTYGVRASYKF